MRVINQVLEISGLVVVSHANEKLVSHKSKRNNKGKKWKEKVTLQQSKRKEVKKKEVTLQQRSKSKCKDK